MSGDPARPVQSVPGVRWGEGKDLQQLQEQLPTPAPERGGPPMPSAPGSAPGVVPAGGPPALPRSPGLLTQPTARPDQPGTAGIDSGPGPGSEILGGGPVQTPTQRFLYELAAVTGREFFTDLARRQRR